MDDNIKNDIPEEKTTELEQKAEEYLNNWKRSAADFINYKKDEMERMAKLLQYSKEDIISEILPILDNIYLAEKHIPENLQKEEWINGFKQIQKQMEDFIKKQGIEVIETTGQKFNPETMEAVALSPEASAEGEGSDPSFAKATEDVVTEELQKGYMLNGKVIRPARVKITK